jgi:small-conductance mechanosensitive channel
MLREIGLFFILILAAGALWAASVTYGIAPLFQLSLTVLAVAAVYLLYVLVAEYAAIRAIKDPKTRYSLRKAALILSIAVLLIIGIRIWIEDTQALLVSYGILAAGLAIALQDLFRNFAGGIVIVLSGVYRVGDRIEADGVFGDVMDIGLLYTTLMEMGGWIGGDQPTGRITSIPNGHTLGGTIHNYTRDHNFIWDEITVPVRYTTDWRKASGLIFDLVRRETAETMNRAEAEIERIGERYYLPRKDVEPVVLLSITDNYIGLTIRYVAEVRSRRAVRDRLSRLILEEIERSGDIDVGSATMEITGTHRVTLVGKDGRPAGTE